jgi:hypothetical protein
MLFTLFIFNLVIFEFYMVVMFEFYMVKIYRRAGAKISGLIRLLLPLGPHEGVHTSMHQQLQDNHMTIHPDEAVLRNVLQKTTQLESCYKELLPETF